MIWNAARNQQLRGVRPTFLWGLGACVAVALLVARLIGLPLGLSVLAMLLLACPVAAAWAYLQSCRPLPVPLGPRPLTRGHTLNWIAPWYNRTCVLVGLGGVFRIKTIELAGLRKGDHVLDAGCGTGALTCLAAQTVGPAGSARGIDAAPNMVRIARQSVAGGHGRARFDLAAIEALPFPDECFDAVFASLVFHHLPDRELATALGEIKRVLKPAGRLLVVEIDRPKTTLSALVSIPLRLSPRLRRHLSGRTAELLEGAQFEASRAGVWGPLIGFWLARPVRRATAI